MQLSNVVTKVAGLDPKLPLKLALGSAFIVCLDGQFMIFYEMGQDAPEYSEMEIQFLVYGQVVPTRTMMQIYINKYCQN